MKMTGIGTNGRRCFAVTALQVPRPRGGNGPTLKCSVRRPPCLRIYIQGEPFVPPASSASAYLEKAPFALPILVTFKRFFMSPRNSRAGEQHGKINVAAESRFAQDCFGMRIYCLGPSTEPSGRF